MYGNIIITTLGGADGLAGHDVLHTEGRNSVKNRPKSSGLTIKNFPRLHIFNAAALVFSSLMIGIAVLEYVSYGQAKAGSFHRIRDELLVQARGKVHDIIWFRKDLLADITSSVQNQPDAVAAFLTQRVVTKEESDAVQFWLGCVAEHNGYSRLALVDAQGVVRLATAPGVLPPDLEKQLDCVLRTGKPRIVDFFMGAKPEAACLGVLAPILVATASGTNGVGALLGVVNPGQAFYPMLRRVTTPERSIEMVLVRREKNTVVILNDTRFNAHAAMRLRIPMSQKNEPDAQAFLGAAGVVENQRDYREIPVLAVSENVPDSPWKLVAKEDAVDITKPLRHQAMQSGGRLGMLALIVILGMSFLWQRREYVGAKKAEEVQQRLHAEQMQSEQRFRATFEQAAVGMVHLDREGRSIRWNQRIADILGYTYDEMAAVRFSDFMRPVDAVRVATAVGQDMAGGAGGHAFELCCMRKDRQPVWIRSVATPVRDANGVPDYISVVVEDISNQKQMESLLRESETKLRSILDNIAIGVALIGPDMVVLEANQRIREWFPDVRPWEADKCFHGFFDRSQETNCEECPVAKAFHDGEVHERPATPIHGRIFRIVACPIRNMQGTITSVIKIMEDVTERLSLESRMRQTQRLESIGTLAGGVAHEINNPINGIMNYTRLITDRLEKNSPLLEFANEITHETERVASIVRNLLQFARHEKPAMMSADMADIVEATMSLVRAVMRNDQVTIELDVPKDLPKILCRGQQIEQVLMNLLTNARDTLNEKYAGHDPDKIICVTVGTIEKGGKAWLRAIVEDHGKGIPVENLERIFDPFFTTKSRDKGTGLGLAISYGIVKEHGGTLTVDSEVGKGTKFFIDLPIAE